MANTKVTGDLIASSTIATGNIADNAVTSDKISGITTAHITEGSNLYYTDARADARITAASTSDLSEGTNLYYTDARADARVALVVDSAPSTLNTLNELADALGDDPNFATTTATSIGLKAPLASPTFTGTVEISATIPRLNFTDLQQDDWAIINDNGEFKFQCTSGSGVALLLDTSNNATFASAVNIAGTLTLDQGSLLNGVINTPASLRINIDSNNNNQGEKFVVGHNQTNINNNNELFVVEENGNATFAGEISSGDDINAGGKVVCANVGSDKKIAFRRTGANNFSIEHDSSSLYFYNETTSELPIRFFNNGDVSMIGGNVGIGTSSPGSKLEVKTSGTNSVLELDNSDSNYTVIQYNASGATKGFSGFNAGFMLFGGESGTTTRLQSGGSYAATILENGNFGIGTTSPERILHLDADQGRPIIQLDKGGDKIISMGTGSSATGADDTIFQMFNEGSELVRIFTEGNSWLNGGNVGIGLTDPDSRLDINAGRAAITAGPAVRISKGGSPVGLIRYDTLVIEADDVPTIRLGENDGTVSTIMSGDSNLRINSTHPIKFFTNGYAAAEAHAGQGGAFAMIIDNSQKVGIGTTGPNAKLDVYQGSENTVQRNYGPGNNQGFPQKMTITKWYPVTSLGTKLLIPVESQGNLNMTTIVRMWGHSAVFNRASGYTNRSFTLDFTFGSLQLIYGLTTLNSTGNVSSVTQTSQSGGVDGEIQVNFTNSYLQSQSGAAYGGVYITLEYMTGSTSKSIIPSGITLN